MSLFQVGAEADELRNISHVGETVQNRILQQRLFCGNGLNNRCRGKVYGSAHISSNAVLASCSVTRLRNSVESPASFSSLIAALMRSKPASRVSGSRFSFRTNGQ